MTTNEKYNRNAKRFEDAFELRKPDKVPIFSKIGHSAIYHSNFTLREVWEDKEKQFLAYSRVVSEFGFDGTYYWTPTVMLGINEALGSRSYVYKDDTVQQVQDGENTVFMKENEYEAFNRDFDRFLINTVLPRKYRKLDQNLSVDERKAALKEALLESQKFKEANAYVRGRIENELGVICNNYVNATNMPDIINASFRDLSGSVLDIRRRPEQFMEACETIYPIFLERYLSATPHPQMGKVFVSPTHLPTFSSPKVFEKVYWPFFKRLVLDLHERGYRMLILCERSWRHLYDFILDLPKASVVVALEGDDLLEAKKILGNHVCICGGLKYEYQRFGTKEQCVDHVKWVLDNVAGDGGFVFTSDMSFINKNDINPENLLAMTSYINEHGWY